MSGLREYRGEPSCGREIKTTKVMKDREVTSLCNLVSGQRGELGSSYTSILAAAQRVGIEGVVEELGRIAKYGGKRILQNGEEIFLEDDYVRVNAAKVFLGVVTLAEKAQSIRVEERIDERGEKVIVKSVDISRLEAMLTEA